MATIEVSSEELKIFAKEYSLLPNAKCSTCSSTLNQKVVDPSTFIILKKLRELYY